MHYTECFALLSALMCTLCVCLSINVWSVHQQLLLSTLTLCYSVLSCVSWAGLAVGAFRSAPKSPALVGISWGKKRLSDPGAQRIGSYPIAILPKPFSSLVSLIWCWPFSSIHFPWNRSHTLMGIAHTPPPSSTLHDLAYFGHWSRRTDRMLPVGKNRIGVFSPFFISHHRLLNRCFLSKLSFFTVIPFNKTSEGESGIWLSRNSKYIPGQWNGKTHRACQMRNSGFIYTTRNRGYLNHFKVFQNALFRLYNCVERRKTLPID